MKDYSREPLNFLNVVRFIFRWRYYFIIICLLSAVGAYIFASPLITDPVYKSSTVFYPVTKGAISTEVLRKQSPGEEDYLDFGEEKQVENYLEILRSNKVKNHLLKKFNLMDHYEIDRESEKPYAQFNKKYKNNFSFTKTEFMALEVEVFDKDPEQAAIMANEVVKIVDSLVNELKQKRAREAMKIAKKKYEQQKTRYDEIADSVQKLAKKGLVEFEQQSKELTGALGKAKLEGNTRVLEDLKKQMNTVGKYGPIYYTLIEELIHVTEKIADFHAKYQQIRADATSDISRTYVLDKGQVSKKEAKPKKLFILIITLIGSFLITFVILNMIEKWPYIKETVKGA